ncbi:hypothetical protein BBV17_06625 [Cytobacillus oceanisediminis]|uniref:Restriction endonuclease type II EcoRII N-terminal domain-containing protein n=2 Tax=Cytobacillus oceanisediminis TaxID=665099 RepID=A0ABX3CZF8_9BACI|nr:hypothetical protein BBV17_06625 [Cytobacillus oceanisediminis]
MNEIQAISKVLSPNDTGETGAHQAGMLIPKKGEILSFFPKLGIENKNPRSELDFYDETGKIWTFTFIYYNNKFFEGTRNEYRLTGMTSFIRKYGLKAGDTIILSRDSDGKMLIKQSSVAKGSTSGSVLKLGSSWKVVRI